MVRGACQAVSGPEQDRWTSCQLHGIVGAYRWITCGVGCILQSNTNSTTLNIPDIKMAKCIHPLPVKHSHIVCYIIHPFNHLCIHACHTRLQCGASNSPWSAVHSFIRNVDIRTLEWICKQRRLLSFILRTKDQPIVTLSSTYPYTNPAVECM